MAAEKTKKVVSKNKPLSKSKRIRKHPPFPYQDFKGRNISRLARTYHHEIVHAILDLILTNRKIQRSAILGEKEIEHGAHITSKHLRSSKNLINDIEETRYHLENFYFRAAAFRDKIAQFVNHGLELGYPENTQNLMNIMSNNRIYKESRVGTELKKFKENKNLKEILSMRIKFSHKNYYGDDYSPLFMPKSFNPKDDIKKTISSWRKNMDIEVSKANEFTVIAIDIANKVVPKVNKYINSPKR